MCQSPQPGENWVFRRALADPCVGQYGVLLTHATDSGLVTAVVRDGVTLRFIDGSSGSRPVWFAEGWEPFVKLPDLW